MMAAKKNKYGAILTIAAYGIATLVVYSGIIAGSKLMFWGMDAVEVPARIFIGRSLGIFFAIFLVNALVIIGPMSWFRGGLKERVEAIRKAVHPRSKSVIYAAPAMVLVLLLLWLRGGVSINGEHLVYNPIAEGQVVLPIVKVIGFDSCKAKRCRLFCESKVLLIDDGRTIPNRDDCRSFDGEDILALYDEILSQKDGVVTPPPYP